MGTYTPIIQQLPNGLDEIGLDLSLKRFPNESLSFYRRRLLLETREPAGASLNQFVASLNRQVGLMDQKIFEVDLIRDSDGVPLAVDPHIEITSSYIRAYHDWAKGDLDFEANIVDREQVYWLRDIYALFFASTYFSIDLKVEGVLWRELRCQRLRYDSTERMVMSEALLATRVNKLNHGLIRGLRASSLDLFGDEVSDPSLIADPGNYYIDKINGVVFTYDPGTGFVSYDYALFPFPVWHQRARAFPLNDKDAKYRTKNTLINDDTGLPDYVLLNSEGARIADETLRVHPLGWGI